MKCYKKKLHVNEGGRKIFICWSSKGTAYAKYKVNIGTKCRYHGKRKYQKKFLFFLNIFILKILINSNTRARIKERKYVKYVYIKMYK